MRKETNLLSMVPMLLALGLFATTSTAFASDYDLRIDKDVAWLETMALYSDSHNPLDFVGQYHNYGLDVIIRNSESLTEDRPSWLVEIQKINQAFLLAEKSHIADLTNDAYELISGTDDEAGAIGKAESLYMKQINNSVEAIVPDELGSTISAIESVENAILKDRALNRTQKARVLGFSAVTKYSLVYWYVTVQDEGSAWQTIFDFEDAETKAGPGIWGRIWKAVKVVGCDAAGFVVGFGASDWLNGDSGNPSVDLGVAITSGVAGATVGSAAAAG